jgi:fumarate hydratase class II
MRVGDSSHERVPRAALYGSQTQLAVENFTISGLRLPWPFISALLRIDDLAVTHKAERCSAIRSHRHQNAMPAESTQMSITIHPRLPTKPHDR